MTTDFNVFRAAMSLFEQEFFGDSLRLTEYGLSRDPDDGALWELKGLILRVERDVKGCLDALEKAEALMRLQPVAVCAKADCFAHLGDRLTARTLYLSVYDDPSTSAAVLSGVMEGLAFLEEWGLCATVARELCHEAPTNARAWHQLAFATAMSDGELSEITEFAHQAVSLSANPVTYRIRFAMLLYRLGEMQEAYRFVSLLSQQDLTTAGCSCALRQLRNIYHVADDLKRREWCCCLLGN